MADRNVDESIRKPRRTKGTPFFRQRNYYASAVVAFGGLAWFLYELWPQAQKLKKSQLEGKFDPHPEIQKRFLEAQLSTKPGYMQLIAGLKQRENAREDALYQQQAIQEPCFHKTKKISKYFIKSHKESYGLEQKMNFSQLSSESPYKNCINEIETAKLSDSVSEQDEFKTPVAIRKVPKLVPFKHCKKPKKRKKNNGKSNQTSMRSFLEKNLKSSDVNADHLQMALALSESSYQAENPDEKLDSQEKMETFKKTLEKYGFGYRKTKGENKDFYEISKKTTKRSRYRFITPILKMRTSEEREALIMSKVSLILAQNSKSRTHVDPVYDSTLFSETLQKFKFSKIFKINHLEIEQLNNDHFHIKKLNLEESLWSAPGHLLKDWKNIAGREESPIREVNSTSSKSLVGSYDHINLMGTKEDLAYSTVNDDINSRVSSPDLFASDEEYEALEQNWMELNPEKTCSEPIRETECLDLTQSDNETEDLEKADNQENLDQNVDSESVGSIFSSSRNTKDTFEVQSTDINLSEEIKIVDTVYISDDDDDSKFENKDNSPTNLETPRGSKNDLECSVFEKNDSTLRSYNISGHFGGDWMQFVHLEEGLEPLDEENESKHVSIVEKSFNAIERFHSSEKFVEGSFIEISPKMEVEEILKQNQDMDNLVINNQEITQKDISKVNNLNLTQENICTSDEEQNNEKEFETNFICLLPDLEKSKRECLESDYFMFTFQEQSLEQRLNAKSTKKLERISTSDEETKLKSESTESSINGTSENCNFSFCDDEELKERLNREPETNKKCSKKIEKISTSEDDSKLSQESICISDEELNYSCAFATPQNIGKENELPNLDDSFDDLLNQTGIQNQLNFLEPQTTEITPHKNLKKDFIIKTKNVTPMADYDSMDTPKIGKELEKFGIKPMKRARGAKMLKYIYDTTHPVAKESLGDDGKVVKKRKTDSFIFEGVVGEIGDEELIFERKPLKGGLSCRIPLHIVWHNFVMSNPNVRENILLYEPLQLEVLHSMLKEQGFRFNIQDLLKFLDQRCITFRTNQGNRHGPIKTHKRF